MLSRFSSVETAAEKKRVLYEGTSVIREGMPVCYNYDSTTNIDGYDNTDGEGTTTDEGHQNEGKYNRVEDPTADNQEFFAGFVAGSDLAGVTGDGHQWLDIYVPNGAVVPVWTDKSIAAKDRLYLEHGEVTLVNATQTGMGVCVAEAVETVDRSSTAGIVLARIHPPFESTIYNSSLGVGFSEDLWEDCPYEEIARNPGLGVTYFDDYVGMSNTTTAEGWVITQTTSGTMLPTPVEGGALLLDTAGHNAADDGIECQLLNCRVKPAAGKTIWFEARVKMNDATDQYYVGLAATDTTIIPAGAMDDAVDKCGFVHLAASTDNKISSITARTSADDLTADVADNTDATCMTVGFRITGLTSVEFYVNGAVVETGTTAANIPNAEMCLTLVCKTEGTDADAEMTVDWVRLAQLGARA